jgi:hypothetical protein
MINITVVSVVQVPFESTMGGFELFSTGVTNLGPELHGWYGAPGIQLAAACKDCDVCTSPTAPTTPTPKLDCACKGTTLFLVGQNFSVQDTQVIAGGKRVPNVTLLSRDTIQVTIPAVANPVTYCDPADGKVKRFVDIHLATPYGVTNHLLVPVYDQAESPTTCAKDEAVNASAVTPAA